MVHGIAVMSCHRIDNKSPLLTSHYYIRLSGETFYGIKQIPWVFRLHMLILRNNVAVRLIIGIYC
jgi:hypothetical protein